MKRLLVLPALATLASFAPVPSANADHLCVYSGGRPLACAHPEDWFVREEICLTAGGRPVVCV